ncbi:MAG: type II toxin-antitoxin system death-on-curing family toxin, partial [Cyanobacteria bacterium J06635_13]
NHPFVDGNKRTSYVVMRTFLKLNGYDLQASTVEKYQVWMQLADSHIDEIDLAEWIKEKSIEIE